MKLRRAGNIHMQALTEHAEVLALVDVIADDLMLIGITGQVVRDHVGRDLERLADTLKDIEYAHIEFEEDETGQLQPIVPPEVDDLLQTIEALYAGAADELEADQRRGAVLEALVKRQIDYAYGASECLTNCLVDSRTRYHTPITHKEVDVCAWNESQCYGEAYECKLRPRSFQHTDCSNLVAIYEECDPYATWLRVGLVSFESSEEARVRRIQFEESRHDGISYEIICVYGCDNFTDLRNS